MVTGLYLLRPENSIYLFIAQNEPEAIKGPVKIHNLFICL